MPLATQFASSIELAQFSDLNALSSTLWKAFDAGHLTEDQARMLSEAIEAKRPKRPTGPVTSFGPPKARVQRSPDKQASIERRRRLARASPVPPELVDQFTQGQHAALTVVAGEIARAGACDWCLAKIAAIAGVCKTLVRTALRKARNVGLLLTTERRRRGQKSLTNVVKVLRRSWGAWLQRIGCRKTESTSDKDSKTAADGRVESFEEGRKKGEGAAQARQEAFRG